MIRSRGLRRLATLLVTGLAVTYILWKVDLGETLHVPRGAVHRIANDQAEDLVVIEVQLGDYLGEDDIVRLEDDYGRP